MHNIHHYLLQTVPLKCTRFKPVANRGPEAPWQPCCLGPGKSKELAHASICTPDWRDITQATKSLALFPNVISLSALDSKSELHSTWTKYWDHSTHTQWGPIRKRILEELFMSFAVHVSCLAVRASQSLHASSQRNEFMQSYDNFYFSLNLSSGIVTWSMQSAPFEHPFLLSLLQC